jgi:general secretion pathway protein D
VVRSQNDLRTIFERKMQERQEFLDRYFVFSDQRRYEPPVDFSRTNGLVEDIRQSMLDVEERRKLLQDSKPKREMVHAPGSPIEWVPQGSSGGGGAAPPSADTGGGGRPPLGDGARKLASPVVVQPVNRNVPSDQ